MNAVLEPRRDEGEALSLTPISLLSDVWPAVTPWLESALEYGAGDENIRDVFVALAREQYQLWTDGKSMAAVTQIQRYPRHTVFCILYAGGTLDALYRAFEFAKGYAKQNGIRVVRVHGRPGWERILGLERRSTMAQVNV